MMRNYWGNPMVHGWSQTGGILGSVIIVLVIGFLFSGIIYFWKEITKEEKK